MAAYFFPAMWEQRRICVAQALRRGRAQSVLEVGCGEGNVLSFLACPSADDEWPVTRLVGVDIDADALAVAHERLLPTASDRRDLRVDELSVELLHGDASVPVPGLAVDAVVCTEVIEHVDERAGVPALTAAVLGGYRPRLAIFTTPNAEFNVNFPDLQYGSPNARFRDADHKFEWTRAQFAAWAHAAAADYGYDVELRGIGFAMRNAPDGFAALGGCSQMASFTRRPDAAPAPAVECTGQPPQKFAAVAYPVFAEPQAGPAALLALVRRLARDVAGSDGTAALDDLWGVLEIRQQFKRRRALGAWLADHPAAFDLTAAGGDARSPGTTLTVRG
ncbi:hypothetical protein IWQ56_002202 [Coemansia nantahalensis]|uniref:Uncharacterized protein n=1 Tax=Coemansia nantahalensis TaxID=2789366 RepID=A0ACC1JMG0_9FUNG|nr:hypothetical protein IWQ57_005662 [Coemansia nantahalensis]KAJ2770332.1 hypothetical protein IWQ56_002202 [Coemansia nantahalensis]